MSYKDVIDLVSGETKAKKRRSIVKGLLIGSAVGVGSSLLLAPRSGRASRQRLIDGVANAGLSVQVGSMKAAGHVKTTVDNLSSNAKAVATDVSTTVRAVQDSMKDIKALKHSLERNARQLTHQSVDSKEAIDRLTSAADRLKSEANDLKNKVN